MWINRNAAFSAPLDFSLDSWGAALFYILVCSRDDMWLGVVKTGVTQGTLSPPASVQSVHPRIPIEKTFSVGVLLPNTALIMRNMSAHGRGMSLANGIVLLSFLLFAIFWFEVNWCKSASMSGLWLSHHCFEHKTNSGSCAFKPWLSGR